VNRSLEKSIYSIDQREDNPLLWRSESRKVYELYGSEASIYKADLLYRHETRKVHVLWTRGQKSPLLWRSEAGQSPFTLSYQRPEKYINSMNQRPEKSLYSMDQRPEKSMYTMNQKPRKGSLLYGPEAP
jgi:hypothetical protein